MHLQLLSRRDQLVYTVATMSVFARKLQQSAGNNTHSGFIANVINNPSVAGYPDLTNTGPQTGVTLINVPAQATSGTGWYWRSDDEVVVVDESDITISTLNIAGGIRIYQDNVTVKNVRITYGGYYPVDYGVSGLVMENVEIVGTSDIATCGIGFSDYTARRVSVTGCADGFKATSNVLIEDCYVTGLWVTQDSHNDGVQTTGGSNVTVRHSTFDLRGISAEIMQLGTEWDANSDWLVENNLLAGGGWVFNGGPVSNMTIRNNRFAGTRAYGINEVDGATFSGNYYDSDGLPATPGVGH